MRFEDRKVELLSKLRQSLCAKRVFCVREGSVGIYFCRASSFEVVEGSRKGFIVKLVVWREF